LVVIFSNVTLIHLLAAVRKKLLLLSSSLPAALRAAQATGISCTQMPILRFFAPQGRQVAPIGVKFGTKEGPPRSPPSCQLKFSTEERTSVRSTVPNFTPHRCNDKGVGPQKLKFLLRFDQNVEYKRPTGAYPLGDFHKICRVSFHHFRMR